MPVVQTWDLGSSADEARLICMQIEVSASELVLKMVKLVYW